MAGTNIPIVLLNGATEDTVGEYKPNAGGVYIVVCEGDFGGGTVTLQTIHDTAASDPQSVYDANGLEYTIDATDDYASQIVLSSALSVRATLAGATSPNLTVKLV